MFVVCLVVFDVCGVFSSVYYFILFSSLHTSSFNDYDVELVGPLPRCPVGARAD